MALDDAPSTRSNIVPSGCVIVTVVVIIAVAIAGYFGYRYMADAFDVPKELESFKREDSVRTFVRNDAAAPADTTRLDASWVAFYVDGVDVTGRALLGVRDALDSMVRAGRATGDTGLTSILTSPSFYRSVTVIEPATKRALVTYLNERGRSLDEYVWAKTRVVAATDITMASVDSSMQALIGRYFTQATGSPLSFSSRNTTAFFERVAALRASGAISDAERALVRPIRARLLERGLGSLYGLDTDFARE